MDETKIKEAVEQMMVRAGVPKTEFYPGFVSDMVRYMMVSFHKYGLVAKAYPDKFDALADVRTRISKYRETGDMSFLVDAANFCMIECMHPRHEKAHWGRNDDDTSPGRVNAETRRLEQTNNEGDRLTGDGFLHIKR